MSRASAVLYVWLALLIVTASAWASVPKTLHYSGKLDTSNSAFTGTIDITFTLYANANATTGFWSESQAVVVHNGRFHVQLGSTTPLLTQQLDVAALHLGVKVATDNEMAKVPISSVPYALQAANAATLGGKSADELGSGKAVRSKPIIDRTVSGSMNSTSWQEVGSIEPLKEGNRMTLTSIHVEGNTSTCCSSTYKGYVYTRLHYADDTYSDHGNIDFYGKDWVSTTVSIPIHAGFRGDIKRVSVWARRGSSTNYNVTGRVTINGYETDPEGLVGSKPIIDRTVQGSMNSTSWQEVASIEPLYNGNLITPTSIKVEGSTSTCCSSTYKGYVYARLHYADDTYSDHGNIDFYGKDWVSTTLTIPIHDGFQHSIERISVWARRVSSTNYNVTGRITINGFETVQ